MTSTPQDRIMRTLVPIVVFVQAEGIDLSDAGHTGVQAVQEALNAKADRDQEWHNSSSSGAYPGGGNELADRELKTHTAEGSPRKVQVVTVATVSAALRSGALTLTASEHRLEPTS